MYKSLTVTWMWKLRLRPHSVFLGIHKLKFLCGVFATLFPTELFFAPGPQVSPKNKVEWNRWFCLQKENSVSGSFNHLFWWLGALIYCNIKTIFVLYFHLRCRAYGQPCQSDLGADPAGRTRRGRRPHPRGEPRRYQQSPGDQGETNRIGPRKRPHLNFWP